MYCAHCGHSVGTRDRVCSGCSYDLLRSGAVRLTTDIPGPGQARPLPPDLWRQHSPSDELPTQVLSTLASTAITEIRRQPSVPGPPPATSSPPPTPVMPRQVGQDDPGSAATPVRIPAALHDEHQQVRGPSRGAKVAIGFAVLTVAAIVFPVAVMKLGLVHLPDFGGGPATPVRLPGASSPAAASSPPAPASQAPNDSAAKKAPATTTAAAPVRFPAGSSSCRDGLAVGANTSCEFAAAVAAKVDAKSTAKIQVSAVSPVTKKTYLMTCSRSGDLISCTGGNNATVYIAGS